MPVQLSYAFVVLIWSTTPLTIVWSSSSMAPTTSVLLRMVIALILAAVVVTLCKIKMHWTSTAWRLYAYSGGGILAGMMLSYLASKTVPSGVISLVFGLAPIISGVLAQKLLGEDKFTKVKKCALGLALVGMFLVCFTQLKELKIEPLGLIYVLFATINFSISGILVKRVEIMIHPMATTLGSLVIAVPGFLVMWLLAGAPFEVDNWSEKSKWSTLYLGIFGSFFGFLAYFHILQKMKASTVALTTLITPGLAMTLGAQVNDEPITPLLLAGTIIIISSLALYQFGGQLTGLFRVNKNTSQIKLDK
ncbi:DMT family transporter [Pseudoalteromonas luteoviolacea]|uniref:DMT family transporter n=1 Tax=Pseudoalteromonas luteoviolacea TaxID=43657 RepID=UPI001F33110E|nr:DMT family transporter [Pseudoalteromonas luteoviolacea]MCF6438210.1 DMT family transporter [Pseudoalteromonas luteoviolacea]